MSQVEQAKDLVSSCAYFELRGPKQAALLRVGETNEVIRQMNVWPEDIEARIKVDNRTADISDLVRPGRAQFLRALGRINGGETEPNLRKSNGPRMG